ncbi:MAG: hypothetical protein M3444_02990 [Acidobacteriota bacterium]|nr:hypothetical protein [Acidobacteriota bacterium]MDQ5835240.1 hypothetical protein [Acidobacteriota bacterium]
MRMRNNLQFDLYLDESGEFLETSDVPEERKPQGYPSQLAGFLVPRGDIKAEAQAVWDSCARAAFGFTAGGTAGFKGTDLRGQKLFRFVRQLVREFQRRPAWEPVRIVNEEAVCYGDQVAAYTNIFAEVILRVLEMKMREAPEASVSVRVFCTTFMRKGYYSTKPQEYRSRIHEYLTFLAVRRGFAAESADWMLEDFKPNFGRERPELRICDVLSNASLGDFVKLDFKNPRRRSEHSKALLAAFDDRNWTLTVRELFERVSLLMEEYSYGMALIAIAEALDREEGPEAYDPPFVAKAQDYVADIRRQLARRGCRSRDPQLAMVLNWLDQIVGHQRLTERGYRLARWLLENVAAPLRAELRGNEERETLDWFEYGVRRWALTAANDLGWLFEAEAEAREMRKLARSLATQWERAPILFDGLIAQAVHLTDAFEFERVSQDMRLIARSLETQSDLFSNYRGGEFPDPIKFDLRAKAIGTLVQSETLKGFADAGRLEAARRLSDAAVEEFTDAKDKARQYQYRCHLETVAGDFAAARRYLVLSIDAGQGRETDFSHAVVGRLLAEAGDGPRWQHDFTASHWLRLGARLCAEGAHEREKFLRAYDSSGLFKTYAESRLLFQFPAHNIYRFLAVIEASRRKFGSALATLRLLAALDPLGKNEYGMALILAACQAEVAALLWDYDRRTASELLDREGGAPEGLIQLLERMRGGRIGEFPRIAELVERWRARLGAILSGTVGPGAARQALLALGGEVRY